MKIKHKIPVSCERTFQGAWRLSAIVGGRLVQVQYFDYTRAEAHTIFRRYLKSLV